jgi:hypothetical protein
VGGRGHVAVCRRPARPPWRLQTHCCLWGDDTALPAMGFETVFLSVRPIVESLARATIPSSTTLFSKSRKVQAHPLGGWEQASAIYLASFSPSKMRGTAGVARCLRLKTAANPSSTSCLLVSKAAMILLSLHPGPRSEKSAFNRMRASNSLRAGPFPRVSAILPESHTHAEKELSTGDRIVLAPFG